MFPILKARVGIDHSIELAIDATIEDPHRQEFPGRGPVGLEPGPMEPHAAFRSGECEDLEVDTEAQ